MSSIFVIVKEQPFDSYGIGKLERAIDGNALVAYFDTPISHPEVVEVPKAAIRAISLPEQTRVYWQDRTSGAWLVGRVRADAGERVLVRFPNKTDRLLPIDEVFVRWLRPIVDPTPFLAHRINETPLFAEARRSFVQAMTSQRAACQGMSALLSSVIDLEPHQVEVVRRVLQDPVQRYLLADEVGLGKTIEAGVLIRQYVLDDPESHRVAVLVPPPLLPQWQDELSRRFLLHAELGKSVLMVSTSDKEQVAAVLRGAGMLVVDEAHHLSRDRDLYEVLREAAPHIPRVLLLSATPVLRNERGFLEMLHLLDSVVFPLTAEAAFRRRIDNRQALAETVAGLVPENVLQIENFLDALQECFPDDYLLSNHAAALRAVLEGFPDETDPEFLEAMRALRAHLSEVYRLDRRILRNRRRNVPGLTPERAGVSFIDFASPEAAKLAEALESWRACAASAIYGKEGEPAACRLATVYADMLAAAIAELPLLVDLVDRRLTALQKGAEKPAVSVEEEWALLAAIGDAARRLTETEHDILALAQVIENAERKEKFVVFCSDPTTADNVVSVLARCLKTPVERYRAADAFLVNGHPAWQRFVDDPSHRILVCDRTAEEGLNLQGGAKVVVHMDLPLDPNRIEQRLGRVDRYGSGASIRSFVLRRTDDPMQSAWAACLAEGLGAFDRSIASLQYLVDDEMAALRASFLVEGLEAVQSLAARLGGTDGAVARELRRLDDQDALDALSAPGEEAFDNLFEVDDDWRTSQHDVEAWVVGTFLMERLPGPDIGRLPPGDGTVRFAYNRDRTLMPLSTFVEAFHSLIDPKAPGGSSRRPITFPYTSRRQTALGRRAREAGVRLLRYGDSLLNRMVALTALDDRGRSVAQWRHVPGYQSMEAADVFFSFDFVVEAEVAAAAECYRTAMPSAAQTVRPALTRRGDMVFPPFFERVWLDAALQPVEDPQLIALLSAPYRKVPGSDGIRDANLNPDRWEIVRRLGLPVMEHWGEVVGRARAEAEAVLRRRTDLEQRSAVAIERTRTADQSRFAQLRMRVHHGEGPHAEADRRLLEVEQAVAEALYEGIRSPRIHLDTIGAIFVSGYELLEADRDE